MSAAVERARSLLFLPGSRMERFDKALTSGADCVILDLEDAVPPELKSAARDGIGAQLATRDAGTLLRTSVRINASDTAWFDDDLAAARGWLASGLGAVVVPKADAPTLRRAADVLGEGASLVPLVESLAGLDDVDAIVRVGGVVRLAFGHLDFQLDLGMQGSEDQAELAPVRLALVAASRRGRIAPPIDGVTTDTRNEQRLATDTARSLAFGFGGKLCIHPAQVPGVNVAFSPSAADIAWARRVIDAAAGQGGRAFSLDGRMVDLPVVRHAQQTLDRAR